MTQALVYLDASAAVKLMRREPESRALLAAIERIPCVSSELLDVELRCTAHRIGLAVNRVDAVSESIDLVPYDADIGARAGRPFDPPQRVLDAIHLATALDLASADMVFVTYDLTQADAACASGLDVLTPSE